MQALAPCQDLALGLGLRMFDPAALLLGNEPKGLAIDGPSLRGLVRGDGVNWSGNINDLLTYSSPSPKWIINKAGLLESGTALRCEYDEAGNPLGVRVETQATNLFNYSMALQGMSGVSIANTDSGVASPLAGYNYRRIEALLDQSAAVISLGAIGVAPAITCSIRIKQGSGATQGNKFILRRSSDDTEWQVTFNHTTGAISTKDYHGATGTATAVRQADGGWRLSVTRTDIANGDSLIFYVGFGGNSGNLGSWLLAASLCVEAGTFATSDVVTNGSTVTRAADNITLPLADFPWNAGSGTLKLNGATVTPILNGASDALDIDAIVAAASATHLKTLTWVPS